eukprot:3073921-Amphidinium_carterae.1
MRNSLLAITVSGRRQRLQERERTRPKPKPAPFQVRLPGPKINEMTIAELREVVQRQEELIAQHHAGYYVAPPIPQLQQYKDRLDILETQLQEEQDRLEQHRRVEARVRQQEADHAASVQLKRQELAELAERKHREELDRQAAMTEVPLERVAQQQEVPVPPLIGADVQTITSSTESSESTGNTSRATTRMMRQEEEDKRDYWEKIMDIMYMSYNDENDIGSEELLHEGVLYWMSIEDIKDMRERARSEKDPEAEQQYKQYFEHNQKLDIKMREEYEKDKGPIENREDFQQALEEKDANAIREIVYEYAKG